MPTYQNGIKWNQSGYEAFLTKKTKKMNILDSQSMVIHEVFWKKSTVINNATIDFG